MHKNPEFNIQKLKVTGLLGRHNIEIAFKNNTLIIVGENGSGKSTLVNILYYTLTRQWNRLNNIQFNTIEIEINNKKFTINKANPLVVNNYQYKKITTRLRRYLPPSQIEDFISNLQSISVEDDFFLRQISILSEKHRIPEMLLRDFIETTNFFNIKEESDLKDLTNQIPYQVLFLPTYRRIERDLQHLFPDLKLDRELLRFNHLNPSDRTGGFLELVEFGMKDVEAAFRNTTQRLDKKFRAELNNLTGEYLRDIMRADYQSETQETTIDPQVTIVVDKILDRMDDQTLPQKERNELQKLIHDVTTGIREIGNHERVVLHYVSKLVPIYENQRKREERITKLVDVCNGYLINKKLKFDPKIFDLSLIHDNPNEVHQDNIPLSGLSSGEKQIVSLFTHIYLSEVSGYIVIIDEPELSISVPWQRTFLVDIMESDLCKGLVAVTHSPFIFENNLWTYTKSMSEFLTQNI